MGRHKIQFWLHFIVFLKICGLFYFFYEWDLRIFLDSKFVQAKSSIHDANINKTENLTTNYYGKATEKEYIIIFKAYYKKETRKKYIEAVLHSIDFQNWTITSRNNFADNYPSDFDVLEFYNQPNRNVLESLENHPSIKRVNIQKFIHSRTLLQNLDLQDFECSGNKQRRTLFNSSHASRKLFRVHPRQLTKILQADILWKMGITGQGVKVAIFDTGLAHNHPHFKNVKERTDWTNERTLDDTVGHGTFVAGVIASSSKHCPGIAPDVELYIFRVFTSKQVSRTSWFLDAFNYAILCKVNILNLSIGGPDFTDQPFIDKVWELTANGIIMVSAVGNDGPMYGTLNNPADQMDVIGVGGITADDRIAKFSSRGMTTWELPLGYGRVKPDLVTYGTDVLGSALNNGCRTLSGTSVACPVVTGALILLVSSLMVQNNNSALQKITPAAMKQALLQSASRLNGISMFEQGSGKLNLIGAYDYLQSNIPSITVIPSYIDLTECQYMWPYCTQALYYTSMPVVVNVTIVNSYKVISFIKNITWFSNLKENLNIHISHSTILWPWSGWVAVSFTVPIKAKHWKSVIEGEILLEIESPTTEQHPYFNSVVKLPFKVKVIPTPPRHKRLLWDQYHNLQFPPGYFPHDILKRKNSLFDWNGDHIHTNFKNMYQHLRAAGYYLEVLGEPFTCFDAKYYSILFIVDTEEEFFPEEISKLKKDVENKGLSVLLFADWYNTTVMEKLKFYDENSQKWWTPHTGGANVPALNDLLLTNWGIALGDSVRKGHFVLGEHPPVIYASGTIITKFPQSGFLFHTALFDQGHEVLQEPKKVELSTVPILGLYQTDYNGLNNARQNKGPNINLNKNYDITPKNLHHHFGRIVIFGDSNCIDDLYANSSCFWLLDAFIEYAITGKIPTIFEGPDHIFSNFKYGLQNEYLRLPARLSESHFHLYSKVVRNSKTFNKYHVFPSCSHLQN